MLRENLCYSRCFVILVASLLVTSAGCAADTDASGQPPPAVDDPCANITCSGHGACVPNRGTVECACVAGFHPQDLSCLSDVAPCDGVLCSGHGTCVATGSAAACACDSGYRADGLTCIVVDEPCSGVTCSLHGTCVFDGYLESCDCDAGYHADGLTCVADPVDPCATVTCSGHGTCVGGVCVCDACYTGAACDGCAGGCIPAGSTCVADATACAAAEVLCVDDAAGPSREYTSIQAAADAAGAGDTVLVFGGTYAESVTVTTGGAAGSPLTLRANGADVVITGDGSGPALLVDGFSALGNPTVDNVGDTDGAVGYVIIDGFRVEDVDDRGIRISWAHHVTVKNCVVRDTAMVGVFADFADRLTIKACDISGAGRPDQGCGAGLQEHGVYFSNSGDFPVLRGTRVYHNCGSGVHLNGDASMGYDSDGIIRGGVIEGNTMYDNTLGGSGATISMDGNTDAVIENNLLYGNHEGGIALFMIDGGSPPNGILVVNNTVVMPAATRWAVAIRDGGADNTVLNNIILSASTGTGALATGADSRNGFISDYNIFVGALTPDDGDTIETLGEWQTSSLDAHSLAGNAATLFVGSGDYHLAAGSPAIDAGTSAQAPDRDLEGNLRPQGGGTDIGAFEAAP